MVKNYIATVAKKTSITPNLIEFKLLLPENISFVPGQFFSLKVDHVRRSYSIASNSGSNEIITYVDLSPNGPGSKYIASLNVNDNVSILAPLGHFIYQAGTTPVTFVATGTGFTPFLSMISYELEEINSGRQVSLIYGVRYQEQVAIEPQLNYLKNKYDNFNYIITLTKPPLDWTGNSGRVTNYLQNIHLDSEVYICGGSSMIFDVEDNLLARGFLKDKIKYEQFY